MDPLTLETLGRALGADRIEAAHRDVVATGAAIDTRAVRSGDLFFALPGERSDGHLWLAEAARSGATAAVVRRDRDLPDAPLPLLRVDDPAAALWRLAEDRRSALEATVVGVTGSNGKTTTKEMIAAVLGTVGRTVRNERSFNNHLGVPLSILRADATTDFLVLEVGTNHPGEIARLAELVRPDVAVVTNIGEAHLGHFGSLRAIALEKAALVAALPKEGTAILHAHDVFLDVLADHAPGPVCTFGREDAPGPLTDIDVWGTEVRRTNRPRGITLHLYGKMKVRLPLQGLHNASNALAALAVGLVLGAEPVAMRDALGDVKTPRMRLERERVGGVALLDDSYNANPASVAAALDELAATITDGRRVFVFGDMAELGDLADEQHRRVGRRAAGCVDVLWTVGERARLAAEAARDAGLSADHVVHSPSVDLALESPEFEPTPGDVVLFKASRSAGLDRLAADLRTRLARTARAREAV